MGSSWKCLFDITITLWKFYHFFALTTLEFQTTFTLPPLDFSIDILNMRINWESPIQFSMYFRIFSEIWKKKYLKHILILKTSWFIYLSHYPINTTGHRTWVETKRTQHPCHRRKQTRICRSYDQMENWTWYGWTDATDRQRLQRSMFKLIHKCLFVPEVLL